MKNLVENLEKTREDLLKKLNSYNQDRAQEGAQHQSLLHELASLRAELTQKSAEIDQLQEAVSSVDSERDFVQGLLDQKTEELAALEGVVTEYQTQTAQLKDQLQELRSKDSTSYKRI